MAGFNFVSMCIIKMYPFILQKITLQAQTKNSQENPATEGQGSQEITFLLLVMKQHSLVLFFCKSAKAQLSFQNQVSELEWPHNEDHSVPTVQCHRERKNSDGDKKCHLDILKPITVVLDSATQPPEYFKARKEDFICFIAFTKKSSLNYGLK